MPLKYLLKFLKGDKPKMEGTLEKMCLHKVRAMRMNVIPDELEKCRYQCKGDDKDCPRYRPSGEICRTKGKIPYEFHFTP